MPSRRSNAKELYIDTESAHATDPSASGAGYSPIPAFSQAFWDDTTELLPTNYQVGSPYSTAPILGAEGWELSDLGVPFIGNVSAAGDGVNASSISDDWLDQILLHIFGTQYTTAGEGVASIPDSAGVVIDAGDPYDVQDLIAMFEAGILTPSRMQPAVITADNGTQDYDIAPVWQGSPTGAGIIYGVKGYRPSLGGGATCAFVSREDDEYTTLLGARCHKAGLRIEAKKPIVLTTSWRGDTWTDETKGSLPAIIASPASSPLVGLVCPFWFNGSLIACRMIDIDFGIDAQEQESTAAANGRADDEVIKLSPKITIEPLYAASLRALKGSNTNGPIMVQLGAGVLSGGVINAGLVYAESAHVESDKTTDVNGSKRQTITFAVDNAVLVGSAAARLIQVARV